MFPPTTLLLVVLSAAIAVGPMPGIVEAQAAATPGVVTSGPPPLYVPIAPAAFGMDPRAYEQALRLQLSSVILERQRLQVSGRPAHYARRRIGGFVGVGAGGAAVVTTLILVLSVVGPPLPHSGEPGEFSAAQRVALPLSFALGSVITLTGLWALSSANSGHLYREQVERLSEQEETLRVAVKQARRERRLVARR